MADGKVGDRVSDPYILKFPELIILRKALSVNLLDGETLAVLKRLERPEDTLSFFDEVIAAFEQETPYLLGLLSEAILEHRAPTISHCAHQLKGLCGNIGINRLAALCEVIEEHAEGIQQLQPLIIRRLVEKTYAESIKELELNWKRET